LPEQGGEQEDDWMSRSESEPKAEVGSWETSGTESQSTIRLDEEPELMATQTLDATTSEPADMDVALADVFPAGVVGRLANWDSPE